MASRRDQLGAYRFLNRRNAGALLGDDPHATDGTLRRLSTTTVASVVVALLVLAVVGLYGLLRPGGDMSWTDGKSLVVERETGTRYVYLSGVLHPVLNYASARLILHGGGGPVLVSRASLATVPHGAPVGIAGAPDSVPAADALIARGWTVCTQLGTDPTGVARPSVDVALGSDPAGTALAPGSAVLVQAGDGTRYAVTGGQRLRLDGAYAVTVLGYGSSRIQPAGDAWLEALPQGPDLAAPNVPGAGSAGPAIGGQPSVVGEVFTVSGTGAGDASASYVVYPDGLVPISAVQRDLLLADPRHQAALPGALGQPHPLSPVAAAAGPASRTTLATLSAPHPLDSGGDAPRLCAELADPAAGAGTGGAAMRVSTGPAVALAVPAGTGAAVDALGGPIADTFHIPPGRGALVRELPQPGVGTGTVYLISDLGQKYAVATTAVLTDLGLSGAQPVPLPPQLLQLFPTGPALDETAAARTVPVPAAGASATR